MLKALERVPDPEHLSPGTPMKSNWLATMAPAAFTALFVPLALGFWQGGGQGDETPKVDDVERDKELPTSPDSVFFGPNEDESGVPFRKRIQGLWKVSEIIAPDWPKDGLDALGYLLISDHFMSLEIQAHWDDTLENAPRDAFETFTAEYLADRNGRVSAQILMGSFLDRERGSLEWYSSNRPRIFAARLIGRDSLRLDWADTRTMYFTRHLPGSRTSRDFFGVPSQGDVVATDFYNEPELLGDEEGFIGDEDD